MWYGTVWSQVWPYLLGLYPVGSTEKQRAAILEHATAHYSKVKAEWQQVEATKKEIELEAAVSGHRGGSVHLGSREDSPTLSTISNSPLLSPVRNQDATFDNICNGSHDSGEESRDVVDDRLGRSSGEEVLVNGDAVSESHDQPSAEVTNHGKAPSINPPTQHHQEDESHDHSHLNTEEYASRLSQDSLVIRPDPEELLMTSPKLDSHGRLFIKELYNIDKDIPRCDRDYE